jgi:putative phosphoesterase
VRYLIISDIHANLEALEAVIADAEGRYERIVNCGDIIGYGPDPNAVTDWVRSTPQTIVRGNHDKVCVGLGDLDWFNPVAQRSAVWTNTHLQEANGSYIVTLPQGPLDVDGFQVIHGAPQDEDEYIVGKSDVEKAAEYLTADLTFFGHTHLQCGYMIHRNGIVPVRPPVVRLENDTRYLINPGSVGQPRDGDARAAYCIYDSGLHTVEFRRTAYKVEVTQRKIEAAELPSVLALRLGLGH